MTPEIHVDPAVLTNAAAMHREASDYLAAVPDSHEGLRRALDALGPIYSEFRRAAGELLDARKSCYEAHSSEHSAMSDELNLAVATWNTHDDDAAGAFRILTDGYR